MMSKPPAMKAGPASSAKTIACSSFSRNFDVAGS
jgi:hypothetical protein